MSDAIKYCPEWDIEIVKHLAEGHSVYSFAGKMHVSRKYLEHIIMTQPTFREAIDVGESVREYNLESQYLEFMRGERIEDKGERSFTALEKLMQGIWKSHRDSAEQRGIGHDVSQISTAQRLKDTITLDERKKLKQVLLEDDN